MFHFHKFYRAARVARIGLAVAMLSLIGRQGSAQTPEPVAQSASSRDAMEGRLEQMTALLRATQQRMEQSRAEMEALRAELAAMRQQLAATQNAARTQASALPATTQASVPLKAALAPLKEQVEAQQAEIRQHEQIKVETASKYPLRVTGLVLFNAFANAGVVDTLDLPSLALPRLAGESHGSTGATVRQTILGLQANGPHVLGAATTADLSTDFFSSSTYSFYSSSNGTLRLRRADVGLLWPKDAVHLGVDGPLISPNNPTSYATVGLPALAWSGNLWTWAPQLRYAHRETLGEARSLELEGGLWDAPNTVLNEVTPLPIPSPGESSRKPAVEGRVSYHQGSGNTSLVMGVGAASGTENYSGAPIHTWAVTGDWQTSLTRRLALSGEVYRGVGLGGFGGGAYKDAVSGTGPATGAARVLGLNAVGGWTQLKIRLGPSTEINTAYGQDGGFAADLRSLTLAPDPRSVAAYARTQMVFGNLIFRPKSYLILSPEYRRIRSWNITGSPDVANVFTVSGGYQF